MPDPQSRHEVKQWVDAMVEARHFKDCSHLSIVEMTTFPASGGSVTHFLPECTQSCLDWDCSAIDTSTRAQMLIACMTRGDNIISCPNDCTYFESPVEAEQARLRGLEAAEVKAKRERRKADAVKALKYLPEWFGKLAWQVQIVMILGVVFVIRPKLALELIQAIKALTGLLGKGG